MKRGQETETFTTLEVDTRTTVTSRELSPLVLITDERRLRRLRVVTVGT